MPAKKRKPGKDSSLTHGSRALGNPFARLRQLVVDPPSPAVGGGPLRRLREAAHNVVAEVAGKAPADVLFDALPDDAP